MKRILLIRLDKIGDLVSTLPVDEVLHEEVVQSEVVRGEEVQGETVPGKIPRHGATALWVLSKGMGFIAEHSVPRREYVELDKANPKESMLKLSQIIRTFQPELAVSFQAPWWVHWVLWKERIPLRVGVRSQWHSFLFLNKTLRQKRSQSLKHEADYNMDLLNFALFAGQNPTPSPTPRPATRTTPVLHMVASDVAARTLLPQYHLLKGKYIVIHPGMAGSARNWPITSYHDLIQSLLQDPRFSEHKIVLTGTPMDRAWTEPLAFAFIESPRCVLLQNKLSTSDLLVILKNASTVIAPSTGVLHLAASLGTHCVGLYSPLQVQRPLRWGARSSSQNIDIFEPSVACPEKHTCLQQECPLFDCMNKISVAEVANKIT